MLAGWSKYRVALVLFATVIVDCYLDDLLGAAGYPSVNLIDYSATQAGAFMAAWVVLVLVYIWAVASLWRSLRIDGWSRALGLVLIASSLVLIGINLFMRLDLAVLRPVGDMQNVAAWIYIESYVERLVIYAFLTLSTLSCIALSWRSKAPPSVRRTMLLVLVPLGIVFIALLAGGIDTIASSPYWDGGSILHGPIYMGSIPRDITNLFEPFLTYSFLVGLGILAGLYWKSRNLEDPSWPILVILFLTIFIQVLPKIQAGTLTEAVSATDFYYTFHHDRSIAFSALPLLVFLASWVNLRIHGAVESDSMPQPG